MSVRIKVALILANVFALYCVAMLVVQRDVVRPSFLALERDNARADMARCVEVLRREIHHLGVLCRDWSAWDDTYGFLQDRNERYITSNLSPASLTDNDLHLLYLFDTSGNLVWGKATDPETGREVRIAELPRRRWPSDHPLLRHGSPKSSINGVEATERGPMLLASRPVLTSHAEGPVRGTLVMGRFLTDDLVRAIVAQTRVDLRIKSLHQAAPAPDSGGESRHSRDSGPICITEQGDSMLRASTTYLGIRGHPVLVLEADIPRSIFARGRSATEFAVASLLLGGALVLLAALVVCERAVVAPLTDLTRQVTQIAGSEDLEVPLPDKRRDEIGTLAREFTSMLDRLARARQDLLDKSYRWGKAEMAAGVLHNVRNALGPLIVGIGELQRRLDKAHADRLDAALRELASGNLSPERQRELTEYVELATARLIKAVRETPHELARMSRQMSWIEGMLSEQEGFARAAPVIEPVPLPEVVRDATKLVGHERGDLGLCVETDSSLDAVGPVKGARLGLAQVIGNLLMNAAEANGSGANVTIRISAETELNNGSRTTHVWVRDDGSGIDPGIRGRVFERGFSTKAGSCGLGLHWSANMVAAMGGRMQIESEGAGKGTCVHLLLRPAD
jgi:two-component system NtrC family sensor kinase